MVTVAEEHEQVWVSVVGSSVVVNWLKSQLPSNGQSTLKVPPAACLSSLSPSCLRTSLLSASFFFSMSVSLPYLVNLPRNNLMLRRGRTGGNCYNSKFKKGDCTYSWRGCPTTGWYPAIPNCHKRNAYLSATNSRAQCECLFRRNIGQEIPVRKNRFRRRARHSENRFMSVAGYNPLAENVIVVVSRISALRRTATD